MTKTMCCHLYVDPKCDTDELVYETETDTQTQKINLWLPKGKGSGGGVNQEFGIRRSPATICKIDKQQGPAIYYKELDSISYNKPEWKRV